MGGKISQGGGWGGEGCVWGGGGGGGGGGQRMKGVKILVVVSCYRHRDKLQPDGPHGFYAEFLLLTFMHYSLQFTTIHRNNHLITV